VYLPWEVTAACVGIAAVAAFALWRLRSRPVVREVAVA
jgi:hypothetical protein